MGHASFSLIACGLLTLIPLGNIIFLFAKRAPQRGIVVTHDYNDDDRFDDVRRNERMSLFPVENGPIRPGQRSVDLIVRYEWEGQAYARRWKADVEKGSAPERQVMVWLDPKDPRRATINGPGFWFGWLLSIVLVAGMLVMTAR